MPLRGTKISQLPAGTPTATDVFPYTDVTNGITEKATALAVISTPAVGRLSINGVEMGDTGWRNVSPLLNVTNFLGTGSLVMRRLGYQVFLRYNGIQTVSASGPSGLEVFTPPSGFEVMGYDAGWFAYSNYARASNAVVIVAHFMDPALKMQVISGTSAQSTVYAGGTVWLTSSAWPASLPGTAA